MGLFNLFKKKSRKDELLDSRQKVTTELKEAEKNFLHHKIDKPTFDSISRERNSDLIRIEAEIDLQKHKELPNEDLEIAQKVSADKRRVIIGLLGEKQKKVYELKIAEGSYLKRKISEEVYQKIFSEVKKEMISIDSQVKAILESEEISRLKDVLKSGGAEIAKQQKLSSARKKQDFADELEEDIFQQAKSIDVAEPQAQNESRRQKDVSSKKNQKELASDSDTEFESPPIDNGYEENKNIPRRLRRRR